MKFLNGESAARVAVRAGATGVMDRWARGFGTSAIMVTAGLAAAAAPASVRRVDFAADVLLVGVFTPDACPGDRFAADDVAVWGFVAATLAAGFVAAAALLAAGLPVEADLLPVAAGGAALLAGAWARAALLGDLVTGRAGRAWAFFAGAAFAAGAFRAGCFGVDCFVAGTFSAGRFAAVVFAAGCFAAGCFPLGAFADLLAGVRAFGLRPGFAAGLVAALVPVFGAALPVDPRLFPAGAAMAGLWFLKFLMPQ